MSRRSRLIVRALSAILLIVGLLVEEASDGTAYWIGWALVALAWAGAVVADIGPRRHAARENARLRAALLGGETPSRAALRPDRPRVEDDRPDR
ncbi:hypothetical protein GA0070607_3431 [Micromonospora coriariae]|uniref:Uncharacterized protein n=1 Tax=Micromonospora coriariae TaxID=285665 RepID=A0A1C4WC49_9ACTN|nr:hypothetical protein [Micromonospora coriariae]SCE93817.1 hypothetical protein GA0070607_3431 [Micromonospora coriariae]